ncbi:CBO0543 family protein [Ammoniphilus sp. 3BR4]|uniref:CBO0543 family protein n=1 Tax=Ammoniphilus sp. 3BR4 TaxID=3158265 RepID=UPI003465447A
MEWVINWTFLILSLGILFYWIRNPPFKDWPLVFFSTGYVSIILAVVLVEKGWFSFPVRFFSEHFQSSILYEYMILPVISVFYNSTTYVSKTKGIIVQAILYSIPLTVLEYLMERHSDLIEYHKWTLVHTFITLILLFISIRYLIAFLRNLTDHK